MDGFKQALCLLPERLRRDASSLEGEKAEEIRLRAGRRPTVLLDGGERAFSENPVQLEELACILERASGASLHAVEQHFRDGYLSARGLRIGICGTVLYQNGRVDGVQSISSLSVRIPREQRGLCRQLTAQLYPLAFRNTLILSPPGGGKTTALRDMIRCLSERGMRVAVVDERNELSSTENGQPHFDLGPHTDVMIGLKKAEAGMLLLRSMNPEIIAMDEITREEDIDAVEQITGCGVGILATAHASDVRDLERRPLYHRLLEGRTFSYAVLVHACSGRRSYTVEKLCT